MNSIFDGFLSSTEAPEAFSASSFVEAMLRFEAALARAQASLGLIPETAAQSIIGTCKVELFDVPKIVRESARAGSLAIPLVKSLTETVGLFNRDAGKFVHFGGTSQDVIDSALALVTRDVLKLIDADVDQAITALLALAVRHAGAPVLERSMMQPASVTSFGLKCAQWAAPLVRSRQRLHARAGCALSVQIGASVGALAQMNGKGPHIISLMASDLQLSAPASAWQTQRDEWAALGCELGLLVGSLGRIACEMAIMSQYEVAELAQASEPGRGADLDTGHGRPSACSLVLAAAQQTPARVAAMLTNLPQAPTGSGANWQTELAQWQELLMSAYGAARVIAHALSELQVDAQRMRTNLDAVRAAPPANGAADCFNPGLLPHAAELARVQALALSGINGPKAAA
jgi:3-carboxy-cis,cis-muconate cycloisomerase